MLGKLKKAGQSIAGGVKDAVDEITDNSCAWTKKSLAETTNVKINTGCDRMTTLDWIWAEEFKYCPFCGDEIKVVEEKDEAGTD